jgi:hypothetical protein
MFTESDSRGVDPDVCAMVILFAVVRSSEKRLPEESLLRRENDS